MFDFGFTRFITSSLVKFFWGLYVIIGILGFVAAILIGLYYFLQGETLVGTVAILVLPVVVVFYLLCIRMGLELAIVFFRIETHLRCIREHYENK